MPAYGPERGRSARSGRSRSPAAAEAFEIGGEYGARRVGRGAGRQRRLDARLGPGKRPLMGFEPGTPRREPRTGGMVGGRRPAHRFERGGRQGVEQPREVGHRGRPHGGRRLDRGASEAPAGRAMRLCRATRPASSRADGGQGTTGDMPRVYSGSGGDASGKCNAQGSSFAASRSARAKSSKPGCALTSASSRASAAPATTTGQAHARAGIHLEAAQRAGCHRAPTRSGARRQHRRRTAGVATTTATTTGVGAPCPSGQGGRSRRRAGVCSGQSPRAAARPYPG